MHRPLAARVLESIMAQCEIADIRAPKKKPVDATWHATFWLLLHLSPNYIHSASNDIHTDGPRATARARARASARARG